MVDVTLNPKGFHYERVMKAFLAPKSRQSFMIFITGVVRISKDKVSSSRLFIVASITMFGERLPTLTKEVSQKTLTSLC